MAPINPEDLAKSEASRIHTEGISTRAKRQITEDNADYPAYWQGYDANRGLHTIQRLGQNTTTNATSISSGGIQPGQAIDTAYSANYTAIDCTPYVSQNPVSNPTRTTQEVHAAIVISVSTSVFNPDTGTTTLPLRGFVKVSGKPLFQLPFGFPLTFTASDTVVVPIAKNDWVFQFLEKATRWKNGSFTTITGTFSSGAYTFPSNNFSKYLLNTSGIDAIDCVVYQQTAAATGFSVRTTDPLICPWDKKWSMIDSGLNPVRWYSVLTGVDIYAIPDTYRGSSGVESTRRSTAKVRLKLTEQDIINLGFTLDTPITSTGGTPFGTFGNPTETSIATIQVTQTSGGNTTKTTLGIARQRAILITS